MKFFEYLIYFKYFKNLILKGACMKPTNLDKVIDLLEKSDSYLYQQEKLYILINGKTYIIHNVNQNSCDYLLKVSGVNAPVEARKYTKVKGERWTPEEEEIILKNPNPKILEVLLPNRTKGAIKNKAAKMREKLELENKKPKGEV